MAKEIITTFYVSWTKNVETLTQISFGLSFEHIIGERQEIMVFESRSDDIVQKNYKNMAFVSLPYLIIPLHTFVVLRFMILHNLENIFPQPDYS